MKLEELVKQYKLKAVCCDMDGVLIDSLGLDLKVVNVLLREIGLSPIAVAFIKANFALSVTDFWTAILVEIGCKPSNPFLPQVVDSYNAVRRKEKIELLPLVRTFLEQTKKLGLAPPITSPDTKLKVAS